MDVQSKKYVCFLHLIIFSFFFIVIAVPTRFSFLNWNLFLALLQFEFSLIVRFCSNKYITYFFCGLWLVIFPNSLYMVTDYLHLQYMGTGLSLEMQFTNYAILSIGIFLGIILGIISLELVINSFFDKPNFYNFAVIELVSLLSSIGIYFGHFLRMNSWDALINFSNLFSLFLSSLGRTFLIIVLIFFILQSFILCGAHIGVLLIVGNRYPSKD